MTKYRRWITWLSLTQSASPNSLTDGLSSITSGFDRRLLHHEDHGALWSSRSVHHPLGHRVALTLGEFDCLATLQVQVDLPFKDEEELVLLVVGLARTPTDGEQLWDASCKTGEREWLGFL